MVLSNKIKISGDKKKRLVNYDGKLSMRKRFRRKRKELLVNFNREFHFRQLTGKQLVVFREKSTLLKR